MSLTVRKVNSVGTLLAGAEFKILKNEQLYGTFSTGEDGTYHLSNMPDGEYRIVETKAPEGYKERPDFAVLNILAGKVTVTSANTQGWSDRCQRCYLRSAHRRRQRRLRLCSRGCGTYAFCHGGCRYLRRDFKEKKEVARI